MKVQNYLMAIAAGLLLCSFVPENEPGKMKAGVKRENLDESAKPGNDFYQFACGGWMANHPLTDEYSRYGSFESLNELNLKQLRGLVEGLAAGQNEKGSVAQKVGDMYRLVMDSVRLNREGYEPVKSDLQCIASVKDRAELFRLTADLYVEGCGTFFSCYIGADMKNSKANLFEIYQSGLTLEEKEYYLDEDEATVTVRNAYKDLVKDLFQMIGYSEEEAQNRMEQVLKVETSLAKASMSATEQRDPAAVYHKMTIGELKSRYGQLDWDAYFNGLGVNPKELNVAMPVFMDEVQRLFVEEDLNVLKTYVTWHLLNGATSSLSDDFSKRSFDFYGKVLSGRQVQSPRWKRGINAVNGALGEAVGQMYVDRYFSAAAKERMIKLVKNLQVALGERIDAQEWMSEETKKKAHEKLDAFYVKVGYPDKWKDYSKLTIDPSASLYENYRQVSIWAWQNMVDEKMDKPVDPTEWHMTPQTVNAYYNPTTNEICFPAGILQYPFFDMEADDAFNYGAIGVVIGHEMTHGFDDQGSQFDKDGNFSNWWTEEDKAKFETRTKVMADFFSAIEVLPGLNGNGQLTLGENIADHGGLEVSFQAFRNATKGVDLGVKEGYTPEQRFFLAYAGVWAGNIREEEIRRRTKSDPHSLGRWRVNGALPHIGAWYEAFGVKEGDALYLPEGQRVSVW